MLKGFNMRVYEVLWHTIADMNVGDVCYTQPWSLEFDTEQYPYLRTINPAQKKGNSMNLRIERIGPGSADYRVYPNEYRHPHSAIPFIWKPENHGLGNSIKIDDLNVEVPKGESLLVFECRRWLKERDLYAKQVS
jgi:hypothetical protein